MEKDKKQLNETTGNISEWYLVDLILKNKGQTDEQFVLNDLDRIAGRMPHKQMIVQGKTDKNEYITTNAVKQVELVVTTQSGSKYTLDLLEQGLNFKTYEKEKQEALKQDKQKTESQNMQKNRLLELAGITETKKYEYADSSEFTEDYSSVFQKIKEIEALLNSDAWEKWVEATESNYSVKVINLSDEMFAKFKEFSKAAKNFQKEFDKADGK
jgi:hypothetical protein